MPLQLHGFQVGPNSVSQLVEVSGYDLDPKAKDRQA